MYPHRIRLRGPWQWRSATAAGTLTLPGRLGEPGVVTFVRRFGLPSNLDAHERVWLLRPEAALVPATLNGQALALGPACDITAWLQPRNELQLQIEGTPGEVALEIRATAYLSDLRWHAGQIHGRVVGFAERALDLYAIGTRGTQAQASVVASEEGTPFAMEPIGPVERVELVNGAVIWYSFPIATPLAVTKPPDGVRNEDTRAASADYGFGSGPLGERNLPPGGGD
jgi:hypothetical protein